MVAEAAEPQLVFAEGCTFTGDLSTTVELGFEGDIDADPDIVGEVTVTYPAMPADTRAWTGGFADGRTLGGTFSGSWSAGSAGVEWAGSFTATRE